MKQKLVEKIVMPTTIKTGGLKFEISPIQDFLIKKEMSTSEAFARAYHTDMTKVFFDYLDYKIKNKENVAVGIKGQTRSGKSLTGHSISWHVANLNAKYVGGKPSDYYHIENVCATESEYAYFVKEADANSIYQIDEQRESKFQMGSVREELYIMDVQNIIAKAQIHSIWIYPTDFIERNCQLGLETIGKDPLRKVTKLMVYDLTKSRLGFGFTPLGYVIIPVGHLWTCKEIDTYKRCDDFGKPICPKFKECQRFMALYEKKKNLWIQQEKDQQMGHMQEQRFKMGEQLGKSEMFRGAPNQKQRRIMARNFFPQLTEGELGEIIEIAKMGISFDELMGRIKTDVKKAKKGMKNKEISPEETEE
jgi:hypothetical protein